MPWAWATPRCSLPGVGARPSLWAAYLGFLLGDQNRQAKPQAGMAQIQAHFQFTPTSRPGLRICGFVMFLASHEAAKGVGFGEYLGDPARCDGRRVAQTYEIQGQPLESRGSPSPGP